ncbi:MAG: ATP-binding protein [Actinomycetota bacterium]|nr:ATP-binding protein [Actinomycetota bacterium]
MDAESVELAPEPSSAPSARRFLRSVLRAWDLDAIEDVVSLLTTELVTNAVLHARTPVRVSVQRGESALRVEVSDSSPLVPAPRRYSPESGTGRGLLLVDELATRWGTDAAPDAVGKTVWFELPLVAPAETGADAAYGTDWLDAVNAPGHDLH